MARGRELFRRRQSNRARNKWAVRLLDVQPTDRVLEIGYGPGVAVRELARRATEGTVVGIDRSAVMCAQATRRNAAAVRAGRVTLAVASVDANPPYQHRFDKIVAVNSIGTWPEPMRRLQELREMLVGGGRIAIVSQPRCPGATAETTAAAARTISDMLRDAGFTSIQTATLDLDPPVACVTGTVADGPRDAR